MIFIVLCHFLQYYGNELAWWFNVGVQIFFCISGYLYGSKKIASSIDFIIRNSKKVLIPYFCFLIPVIVLYFVFNRELIGVSTVVYALLTSGTIDGIEHLWFIAYILFCYLMTPYLQALACKMKKLKWHMFLCAFGLISVLGFLIFYTFKSYFFFSRIFCYLFGYFGAVFLQNYKKEKIFRILTLVLVFITIITNTIRIYFNYINPISSGVFDLFVQYSHALLGISITFLFIVLLKNTKRNKILDLSDKYSFYIYIVHQLFILSPFSLLTITHYLPLNFLITIIAILLSALLLKFIADYVEKLYTNSLKVIKAKICIS